MRKIVLKENFFKDIVFNVATSKKYLFMNKIILVGGIILNAISFLIYSFTGLSFFHDSSNYLRLFNILAVTAIFAIKHRINANRLNVEREISYLNPDTFATTVKEVDILPVNFIFNEDLSLKVINKIFKEDSYFILRTDECEYTFKLSCDDVFLVEDEDTQELEEIKRLQLLR